MVFTHAFAGASLTRLLDNKSSSSFSKNQINLLYFVGIFAAIMPDLDIVLLLLDKSIQHRLLISHSISPYLLLALLILLWGLMKDRKYLKRLALVFFLGALSHLLLDFISGGVALWAPISYRLIGIPLNFPTNPTLWAKTYLSSGYMLVEALLFISYLISTATKKNKILIALPLFFMTVAIFIFIGLNYFYL